MTNNNDSKTSEAGSRTSLSKEGLKSRFKSLPYSKFTSAVFFILLGVFVTTFAQNYHHKQKILMSFDPNFHDYNRRILEEVEVAQERIDDILKYHHKYAPKSINRAKAGGDKVSRSEVFVKQDNQSYYYELDFSGFKKEDINVKIKDNVFPS